MIVEDAVRPITRTEHPRWLQRPTILPDELAHSYTLRVLILNAAASLESLIATVAADGVIDPKVTKIEFLAWVAEIDVSEFLRFHTLVPFQQAFSMDAAPRSHGEKRDSHLRHDALWIKEPFFRFCAACKHEDLGFWGFPIIRVSHHIPGVECCEKHMQPLISTDFATSSISRIQKFSWGAVQSERSDILLPQDEITQRYAAISSALMARSKSIPVSCISKLIASRAKQQGLRRAHRGKRKNLSDLVLEIVPKDWIERLLPHVLSQKSTPGGFTTSLDQTMNSGAVCRPEAYVVALAVLYSDADEALSDLTNAIESMESLGTSTQNAPCSVRKPATKPHTAIEVTEAYFQSNFSYTEMARRLGRSKIRIRQLLARWNLPPARLIGSKPNREALLLFRAGSELQSACTQTGAKVTDVINLLRFDLDLLVSLIRRS